MTNPIDFQNGYSVTERDCQVLEQFVKQNGIKTVLEFGPGRSTLAFAKAGCEVWTAEYQDRWFRHYQKHFASYPNIHVVKYENHREIAIPEIEGFTFDLGFVDSPAGREVIEDDPPRLNTCRYTHKRTKQFLLHDAQRPGEQATLASLRCAGWQIQYPWLTTKCAHFSPKQLTADHATTVLHNCSSRSYDFSHWPSLPKISCQCITYGRPLLLDEAVESFLRQDYPGERELVILNDLPGHELIYDHPLVRIVNLAERVPTVGEKRNLCVDLCTGEIIFPWDDDDISLPHRISYSLQQMTNHTYFKADRFWYWSNGQIRPEPQKAVAHAMGCWSKAFFEEVGGYPPIQSGQDTGLEEKMAGSRRMVESTPPSEIYYIYRFPGTGSYHLSAHGHGNGYEQAASFVAKRPLAKQHQIYPAWRQDYQTMISELSPNLDSAQTANSPV